MRKVVSVSLLAGAFGFDRSAVDNEPHEGRQKQSAWQGCGLKIATCDRHQQTRGTGIGR